MSSDLPTVADDLVVELTASIVSAYVSNNSTQVEQVPTLIASVHKALSALGAGAASAPVAPLVPAVPVKKSLQRDYLICLEDGMKFKSLKRHLKTKYDMTPEQYRAKWNLDPDYPMTAPAYSEARSALAKQSGLGQMRKPTAASKSSRKAA